MEKKISDIKKEIEKVSVITTIFNEKGNVEDFLRSVFNQSFEPSEVVVVDGGSTDGTIDVLHWLEKLYKGKLRVYIKPGYNISAGRNYAISKAKYGIIASVDGGATIEKHWLGELVKPLLKSSEYDISSGFFKPVVHNTFEKYLAATTIPVKEELTSDTYLPSSRSIAFRKSAWAKVGGYPEWLPICEDLIFDIKLKNAGFVFKFTPEAVSSWSPRETLKKYFIQYFKYARGDGHGKLWARRHAIRYITYISGALILYASLTNSLAWFLPLIIGGVFYMLKFYNRFFRFFPKEKIMIMLGSYVYIPLLVVIGDVAKMIGYPVGIYERKIGKIKFEEYK